MSDNSVLSEVDMNEISAALDVLRPSTCVVSRPTGEVDEAGADLGQYDTVGAFECRIDEGVGGMPFARTLGPAVISKATAIISFARGVSLQAHDLIEDEAKSRLFRVIYVPDPSYSFEVAVPVTAATSRSQGGGYKR
jgi:hypothetical protein